METNFSLVFEFIINNFGTKNIFWTFYILNVILAIISYKLGFARKLPIVKSVFVYIVLAIGTFVLTIFSILKFPITESLIIISLILGIYRLRLHKERKAKSN